MKTEFESIFVQLRGILQRHSAALKVTHDAEDHYCLEVAFSPKLKKAFPVAWVKIGKAYVSYHFMPVYMFPTLLDGVSRKLRTRMQGKSCFNFKVFDETLFNELEDLTVHGFAACRNAEFGP